MTRWSRALVSAVILAIASGAARAQQFTPAETFVPPSNPGGINFQGRLEERGALVNGARPMVFRLYDAAAAGAKLWDSGIQTVSVEDGIFGLVLNIPTQALLGGTSKFLELEVDNLILLPREQLRSVPYAKIAERVEGSIDIPTGGLRITTSTVPGDAVFVSSITGLVGIGSTAPLAKLTVSSSVPGAVASSPDLVNPSATAGTGLRVTFNFDPAGAAASYAAAESVRETAGGDARLSFYTRAGASFAERVRVTPAGEVGISTPTPAAQLHVATGSPAGLSAQHATQPRLTFRRAAADVWVFDHDGTSGSAGTVTATDLVFDVGGSSKARVASGGDVSIGLAAAARKLDVGGALRASTVESSAAGAVGAPALILGADPDTGLFAPGADILAASVGGTERLRARNTGAAFAADATLGNASGGSSSAAPDLFLAGNLSVDGQIVGVLSKSTDSVGVSTNTIPGQNFKVGAGSFTVLEAGRVGIGTTAPGFALELQARSQPAAAVDHATAGRLSLRAGSSERMQFAAFASSAVVLTPAGGTDLLLGGLLRLDSGGFVGINGANPPSAQLQVVGDLSVTGPINLGTPLVVAQGGTGSATVSAARAQLDVPSRSGAGASGSWPISISNTAGSATRLVSDGTNCAIADEFMLGIDAFGNAQSCLSATGAGFDLSEPVVSTRVYDGDNVLTSSWVVGAGGSFDIEFDTNTAGDSTFFLDSSADRIGIGDRTPSFKLEVAGDIETSGKVKQGGGDLVPAGAIAFTTRTSCPAGWAEYTAARGFYVVALPASGTSELTGGTALGEGENRAVGQHNHTFAGDAFSHGHTFSGAALAAHGPHTFTGNAEAAHNHSFTGSALGTHNHAFAGNALAAHGHGVTDPGHNHGVWSVANNANDVAPGKKRGGSDGSVSSLGGTTGIALVAAVGGTPSGTVGNTSGGTPAGSVGTNGGHTDNGTVNGASAGTPAGTISSGDAHTDTGTVANSGSTAGTNAPFIQLLACQRLP